jgi:hypothetical protein
VSAVGYAKQCTVDTAELCTIDTAIVDAEQTTHEVSE